MSGHFRSSLQLLRDASQVNWWGQEGACTKSANVPSAIDLQSALHYAVRSSCPGWQWGARSCGHHSEVYQYDAHARMILKRHAAMRPVNLA